MEVVMRSTVQIRRDVRRRRSAPIGLAIVAILGLAACSGGEGGDRTGGSRSEAGAAGSDGVTAISEDGLTTQLDALPKGDPSPEEIAGLVRMREEELLARDVYEVLGDRWGTRVFANISTAEQTHTDAVAALLDRYEILDPARGHQPGSFVDADLQRLYGTLVGQGNGSLVAALTVGATVEDLDLADLAARASDLPDIDWVYENLARGSRNHLRAFVRQLDRNGATYTPTHITVAEFDAIIAGGTERGPGA